MADEQQTRTPEQIRADIEATREELGDTVEQLAHKTDVKARAQDRVEEVKADLNERKEAVKATVTEKAEAVTGKVKSAAPGGDSGPSDPTAPSAQEKVQESAQQVAEKAKANPLPIAIGVALVLGYLIGRRRSR